MAVAENSQMCDISGDNSGPDERASGIEIIHVRRQWQITWFDFPQSSVQSDIPKTKATGSVATTQLFNYCPSLKEVHILLYRWHKPLNPQP